jgi:hypothetical protein
LLRGSDVQELKELQRQGMSIQAISAVMTGDAAPPKLLKAAMIPKIEPEHFVDMSVQVV